MLVLMILMIESSNAIFNLSEKEITKIFKTSFGYKIFYLNKINPKKINQFSEVKEQIKKDILKEKANEKFIILLIFFMKSLFKLKVFLHL